MHRSYLQLPIALLMAVMLSTVATAAETIQTLQQKIEAFKSSSDYLFAPSTAAKASAYLGAAMIADENLDNEQSDEGVAKALAALTEARENAKRFQEQYAELLSLKKSATLSLTHIKIEDPLEEPNPKRLLRDADESLQQAIKLFEDGDLNNTQQRSDQAVAAYTKVIDIVLPALIDKTGSIISKAAAAGAKNYAPKSYEAAKRELSKMEQYSDGITQTMPAEPGYALTQANRALQIAKKVKLWRKTYGSHEELYLKARSDRIKLAEALNIELNLNDPNTDISADELQQAISQLNSKLADQKSRFTAEIRQMKDRHKIELEQRATEQRATLLSDQNVQLSNLKEAFRAKLERETFESKRQKRIQNLFKKGAVELLVNLDGSLLIRLTSLQFAPGSSKIDTAQYKLLGNLKEALDVYGDRNIRIEGHTDSKGDVKINQKISLKRAEAVRDFLVAATMDGSRIKALGYGEVRPVASNEFKKGRAMNRRIDIVIEAQHD